MLIKLIKHDFISLGKRASGLWIVLSIFALGQILISKLTSKGANDPYSFSLAIFLMGIVAFLFSFSGFIISISWFSKKMYSEQGYLTHTLPAKPSMILLSKVMVSFLFSVIGGILAVASMIIMNYYHLDSYDFTRFLSQSNLTSEFVEFAIKGIIQMTLLTLTYIMVSFFSISLSNIIDYGNKSFNAILIFFGIIIGSSLILMNLGLSHTPFSVTSSTIRDMDTALLSQWIQESAIIVILFFGTLRICSKHLKLN